jgi:anti-anti-sigma factor
MDEPVRITDQGNGTLEVSLYGDIDFSNSPGVRERIKDAVARLAPTTVRIDLGAVTFLDSSGIAVLVVAHRMASAEGAVYTVVNASPGVYEHLRLTGLAELFGLPRPPRPAAADSQPDRPAPPPIPR